MRVFISGLGAISAAGQSVTDTWRSVQSGEVSWGHLDGDEFANCAYPIAGVVNPYKPRALVRDKKILKLIAKHDVLGLNAADQAVADSGLIEYRNSLETGDSFNDRTGVYVGSPGNKYYQQYDFLPLIEKAKGDLTLFADDLFSQVHPMWLLKILPNNVLAYTGIQHGFKGANQNITNHVTSGLQAIIEAHQAITLGQIDRAVVVAYEHGFEAQAQSYYGRLGILSKEGLFPFDERHNGTVLAEGAAAIVLENEQSVKARGATTYAEVLSYGQSSDAKGIFSIEESGEQLERAISQSLHRAKCQDSDVGVICAHANGNQLSDDIESRLYSSRFKATPVTGFKWSMGHLLAASGVMDTLLTSLSLTNKVIPGIANFRSPSQTATELNVSMDTQTLNNPVAMVVNRGFAGMNSVLTLRAC